MKIKQFIIGLAVLMLAGVAQAQTNTTPWYTLAYDDAKAWATSDPVATATNWSVNVGALLSKPVGSASYGWGMYGEALVPVTAQSKFGFGVYEPNAKNIYDGTISYTINDTKSTAYGDFTLGAEVVTMLNLTSGNPAAGGFADGAYDFYLTPTVTIGFNAKYGYIDTIRQVFGAGIHGTWSF